MTKKVIRSATFPGVYLRLDGNGVTHPVGDGGGIANCQYGAGPYETLDIVSYPDGTATIGSTVFPNVFLRLDGSGLTRALDAGGGRANCQFTAGLMRSSGWSRRPTAAPPSHRQPSSMSFFEWMGAASLGLRGQEAASSTGSSELVLMKNSSSPM